MTAGALSEELIWHDVECGAYEADLPLWAELASAATGPVLELGCGSGRVTLHLSRRGATVTGIDSSAELVAELRRRAEREALELRAEVADAGEFGLHATFGLIVAPMQLIQLLAGPAARRGCLQSASEHLAPGGRVALAVVEGAEAGAPVTPPLPDVRELDGWIYSSLPLGVTVEGGALVVKRLRQTVSPDGSLRESRGEDRLQILDAELLEAEAGEVGLIARERLAIGPTAAHVGSTVVVLETR